MECESKQGSLISPSPCGFFIALRLREGDGMGFGVGILGLTNGQTPADRYRCKRLVTEARVSYCKFYDMQQR